MSVGGAGVAAPNIRGIAIGGLGVGGVDVRGIAIAVGSIRVRDGSERARRNEREGRDRPLPGAAQFRGVAVSAFNDIRGAQLGLAIGILNLAHELHGVQVGLINVARNNPSGRRVLPILNWNFGEPSR